MAESLLYQGEMPATLEALSAECRALLQLTKRAGVMRALAVAGAWQAFFQPDTARWREWAVAHTELDGCELHHARQVGVLLLAVKELHKATFKRLIGLAFRSIRIIAQVGAERVPAFCSHYRVETMTRDAIAQAVAEFLDKPARPAPIQPELPGFTRAMEEIVGLGREGLIEAVATPELAQSSLLAGMGLIGAALEQQLTSEEPDIELLTVARDALAEEVARLDQAIERVGHGPQLNG